MMNTSALMVPYPPINEWKFITRPTVGNLIEDMKQTAFLVSRLETRISKHRDSVLELDYHFESLINNYKCQYYDYRIQRFLDSVEWFILITDKSVIGFNMEVQVTCEGGDGFRHESRFNTN
jgi:hypothetical protein